MAAKIPAAPALRAEDIAEGAAKLVRLNGEEIAVFKHRGKLCALQNACPHEGGQLSAGRIEGGEVVCPLHGYRFDLQTGACGNDPKLQARTYPLVADGEGFTLTSANKERR